MGQLINKSLLSNIKEIIDQSRQSVRQAVNIVMVETYWNVGKQIYEAQGESERARYGEGLLNTCLKN